MSLNHCVKMVPLLGLSRRLASPVSQQVRTLFDPWSRSSDIRALVRDMDRQMDRLEREMFRGLPSFFPRLVPVDNTLGPREGGHYRVDVNVAGFKPEEINIALDESGRKLTISAKCERRGEDGSRLAQQMSRELTLPESIDSAQLKSMLHHDGVLAIEAPFIKSQDAEPKQIPINRSCESQEQEPKQQVENGSN